jgi:hypothetical protein
MQLQDAYDSRAPEQLQDAYDSRARLMQLVALAQSSRSTDDLFVTLPGTTGSPERLPAALSRASALMADTVGMRIMTRTVKAHAPAAQRITEQAAAAAAAADISEAASAGSPAAATAASLAQQQQGSGSTGSSNIQLPGPEPPGPGGVLPSLPLVNAAAAAAAAAAAGDDSAPTVEPSSACGAAKLVATAKRTSCRIRSYWLSPKGRIDNISTCSGFKLLPDVLGTATHCIYNQVTAQCSFALL